MDKKKKFIKTLKIGLIMLGIFFLISTIITHFIFNFTWLATILFSILIWYVGVVFWDMKEVADKN